MTPEEKAAHGKRQRWSEDYISYWIFHPGCEARCGAAAEPPHHIRTRKTGGGDEAGNLVGYCLVHHRMAHNVGDLQMGRMYRWLEEKILAAKGARRVVYM